MRSSWCAALVFALVPSAVSAQAFRIAPIIQPELRAGAVLGSDQMLLAGFALNVPAGYYLRIAGSAEYGRVLREGVGSAGRAELVGRFMVDPFHQSRWGAYGGGGVTALWTAGTRGRTGLLLVAGVELPGRTGWRPAIEVAGGGGLRISLAIKPVRRTGR
jgi:hypothetical protein